MGYRKELKYLVVGALLLGLLALFSASSAAANLEQHIVAALCTAARFGVTGIFLGALVANISVGITIPYTALMLTLVATTNSFTAKLVFGLASGLGASAGELLTYIATQYLLERSVSVRENTTFAALHRFISQHPRTIPLFVFGGAASFLPDDLILLPLALTNYPLKRLLLPMLSGKILHNLSLIGLWSLAVTTGQMNIHSRLDLSLAIVIVSLLFAHYQHDPGNAPLSSTSPIRARKCGRSAELTS